MELKPCPFCGGSQVTTAPNLRGLSLDWVVICKACGGSITHNSEAEAVAAWNTRPDPAAPLVEALRAIMARMESARAQIWRTPGIADQYIAGGLEEARDALAQRETQHAGE